MRILFVAATSFEVESLKLKVESYASKPNFDLSTFDFKVLVTGVGMVATAFALGTELAKKQYDLAINLGIAGSFDKSIALGELVEVTTDTISELGAEDDQAFLTIAELGFGESTFRATASLSSFYQDHNLKQAAGITVNTVHGNEASIEELEIRLYAQIESMEGAAFLYACREAGVPCLQIRSVSNYVEKRDRDNWQIGLAVKNLNTFATELLEKLNKSRYRF